MDESTLQESQVSGVPNIPNERLQEHPELVRGKLSNGFEYVILPNGTPPQRFEAHLEMHAGELMCMVFPTPNVATILLPGQPTCML